MTDGDKAQFKPKQIFSEALPHQQIEAEQELTAQVQFQSQQDFVAAEAQASENSETESKLEQVIRPKSGSKWLVTTVLTSFAGLITWQATDNIVSAIHTSDWLSLGWSGFIGGLSLLGVGALAKELFKLRKLRRHFSVQQQSEALLCSDDVGQGREFCQSIAKQSGVKLESASYDRWVNSINTSHSDAEILDMYDAMVVVEQDKSAVAVVTQHATESAALVALSPLAIADILLVAWRNFKMIDSLAAIYGVELSYWSRIELLKATLKNLAAAGVSELAVDVGSELVSMDLVAKISTRAGQGLGVGILTARLGLKAMALLRPIPWHKERRMKLSAIRKQIVNKITSITKSTDLNK